MLSRGGDNDCRRVLRRRGRLGACITPVSGCWFSNSGEHRASPSIRRHGLSLHRPATGTPPPIEVVFGASQTNVRSPPACVASTSAPPRRPAHAGQQKEKTEIHKKTSTPPHLSPLSPMSHIARARMTTSANCKSPTAFPGAGGVGQNRHPRRGSSARPSPHIGDWAHRRDAMFVAEVTPPATPGFQRLPAHSEKGGGGSGCGSRDLPICKEGHRTPLSVSSIQRTTKQHSVYMCCYILRSPSNETPKRPDPPPPTARGVSVRPSISHRFIAFVDLHGTTTRPEDAPPL